MSSSIQKVLRYPKIGKLVSTLLGGLEVPFLQTILFLEKHNWFSGFRNHYLKVYRSQIIPLNISLQSIASVTPTEEILGIINRVEALGIGFCYCRSKARNCDNEVWSCIHIGTAESLRELSKRIPIKSASVQEVEKLLFRCNEAGLVHQLLTAPNQDYFYVICNCCPCCCFMLNSMLKYGIANAVLQSNFISTYDSEKCNHCGTCTKYCYFGARKIQNGLVVFDPSKCVGCGLCVVRCENNAIKMVRRAKID